ncbi:MAG: hypothetical protein ACFE9T_09955 [Promethearchaeota archaeon]
MPKKKKSKKIIQEDQFEQEMNESSNKNLQLDMISEINDLKFLAESCLLNNNYDKAVNYAEQIIRKAIKMGVEYPIEEQERFLKKVAEKVQKDYFENEIEEAGKMVNKIYDILLNSENVIQAHEIVQSFKEYYKNNSFFNSIPLIQDLITKDKKNWIRYYSTTQNNEFKNHIDK